MRNSLKTTLVALGIAAVATPAIADETDGFGLYGIGGDLGFVSPSDGDGTFTFGAHANLGAPIESMPELLFYPFFTYWTTGEDFAGGSFDFSEWGIGMDARYFFPTDSDIGLFGFAGLGVFGWSTEANYDEGAFGGFGGFVDDFSVDDTGIGFRVGGGARTQLSETLQGTGQVLYKIGDADYFGILAGITWIMGD